MTDRFKIAYSTVWPKLSTELKDFNLLIDELQILIVAFKESKQLIIYIKSKEDVRFKPFAEFPIFNIPGTLGPKQSEGDHQVPEGFYEINRFNPKSRYHLSLGLNYPNEFDRINNRNGSDIFIHGGSKSEGCLAIGDNAIEYVYVLANIAKENGQKIIPVYIFPFHLTQDILQIKSASIDPKILAFWKNLQQGYFEFMTNQSLLTLSVKNGQYCFM